MVPPSSFSDDRGRRRTQALMTWNVTCSYSRFQALVSPTCVSLYAFYNETIVQCPQCSCGCQGNGENCIKPGETPPLLQLPHGDDEVVQPLVAWSQHMCPIRVHWHVKESYRAYWRVKMKVTNLNFVTNYRQWSLGVQHPNFQSVVQVFSFNYQPLNLHGSINDTGMFWGIRHYNDFLIQCVDNGTVQTKMLLQKDLGNFTFNEGWAFPRKISFNGEECVVPPPNDYPGLPNVNSHHGSSRPCILPFLVLLLAMIF